MYIGASRLGPCLALRRSSHRAGFIKGVIFYENAPVTLSFSLCFGIKDRAVLLGFVLRRC